MEVSGIKVSEYQVNSLIHKETFINFINLRLIQLVSFTISINRLPVPFFKRYIHIL